MHLDRTFQHLVDKIEMTLNTLINLIFKLLYRAEIFYPSMRALAQQMGRERDYEVLISGSQSFLPPPGASEVDVKAWQVQYNY